MRIWSLLPSATEIASPWEVHVVTASPRIFLDDLVFPEGPRWHHGRLCFSDIHAHQVMSADMEGHLRMVVAVPNKPSGLGWLPDGRLLVVSMLDNKLMRLDPDGLKEVADLSPFFTGHANDMVVDKDGRAYIGNTVGKSGRTLLRPAFPLTSRWLRQRGMPASWPGTFKDLMGWSSPLMGER